MYAIVYGPGWLSEIKLTCLEADSEAELLNTAKRERETRKCTLKCDLRSLKFMMFKLRAETDETGCTFKGGPQICP